MLMTLWYQFIDRSYWLIQVLCVIGSFLAIFYLIFVVPESPRWSYTIGNFDETKKTIKYVASFNGMPVRIVSKIGQLKFDKEKLEEVKEERSDKLSKSKKDGEKDPEADEIDSVITR